jgi:hypothetical protein
MRTEGWWLRWEEVSRGNKEVKPTLSIIECWADEILSKYAHRFWNTYFFMADSALGVSTRSSMQVPSANSLSKLKSMSRRTSVAPTWVTGKNVVEVRCYLTIGRFCPINVLRCRCCPESGQPNVKVEKGVTCRGSECGVTAQTDRHRTWTGTDDGVSEAVVGEPWGVLLAPSKLT